MTHSRSGDRRKLGAVLDEIARDDRITAAAVCTPSMKTLAQTKAVPKRYRCEALALHANGAAPEGVDLVQEPQGGLAHAAIVPVRDDEGATVAQLVVVHDLSFVERREAALRRFTVLTFGVVALLASIATVLVRRVSWRSWTDELRRLVARGRGTSSRNGTSEQKFAPLLSDLRTAIAELNTDQAVSSGGRWTPERLHRTLTDSLEGESVVIVANREPYIHDRAPDRSIRILHPASGLVTALEPVMAARGFGWRTAAVRPTGTSSIDTTGCRSRRERTPTCCGECG
jgi:trehalose 6-phosphate synthase